MKRRNLLRGGIGAAVLPAAAMLGAVDPRPVKLFLCGDVMTGRGIDQILPHPSNPELHESWVRDARDYVALAEEKSGPIARPVDFDYVWGDALTELARHTPDVRLINLETSITRSNGHAVRKGIHYRMHPRNVGCLTALGVDCCALANNHVLDWGASGLVETLATLETVGIRTAGAGVDRRAAIAPAVVPCRGGGRVIVVAVATPSSGVPRSWSATAESPGIHVLDDLGAAGVERIGALVYAHRKPGDIVVLSIHWGGNWGYSVPDAHRRFAHLLIDQAGVDVVHGHSSHHPLGLELYHDRIVIYGCGDFLNDYEGIGGHEEYRADLTVMYFVEMDSGSGRVVEAILSPMRLEKLRLVSASPEEVAWMAGVLDRESLRFSTRVIDEGDGRLRVFSA